MATVPLNGHQTQPLMSDLGVPTTGATYQEALALVLGELQAKHPGLTDVLGRAHAVLLEKRLTPEPDGHGATVRSQDGTDTYHVDAGVCDCPTATLRPTEVCLHRYSLRLHQMVLAHLAMQAQTEAEAAHEPTDEGWPPDEALAPTETHAVQADACTDGSCPILLGMERSPQVHLLMAALARAQAHMPNPTFDKTNPAFKGARYASLTEVRNAVMPALTAEGIAVTQLPTTPEPGWVGVTTGLWHGSGQYLCSTLRLPVQKGGTPHDYGSALTYARRYALQGICNVAGDEDDDGNAASGRST